MTLAYIDQLTVRELVAVPLLEIRRLAVTMLRFTYMMLSSTGSVGTDLVSKQSISISGL